MKKGTQKIFITKEELYNNYIRKNMSLSEMSRIYHVSSGALTNYLKKAGITMKKAIPRNQTGSNNGNWKGDNAGYSAFHYRVEKIRGKPKKCEECGTENPKNHYDWANMTGKYEDINDYKRLCRECHIKEDTSFYNNRDSKGRWTAYRI